MKIVYGLRSNPNYIADVQDATQNTPNFGIETTFGLFGSEEWWNAIASGHLPLRTLRGTISRVFMGSMGDWPSFELTTDTGERSSWTREANSRELAALYREGRRIELDFVTQRSRHPTPEFRTPFDLVIEIRVSDSERGE